MVRELGQNSDGLSPGSHVTAFVGHRGLAEVAFTCAPLVAPIPAR